MKNNAWVFVVFGAVVMGGLLVLFRPPTAPQTAPAMQSPQPRAFDLVVKQQKLVSGPAVIQVREGDAVVLTVTSDQADELHLHGYDRHVHLKPGAPATLKFTADKTGRFEYELHKAQLELGALEVRPY